MTEYIVDIYPEKAQYLQSEPVSIMVELFNPAGTERQFELEIRSSFLNHLEDTQRFNISILPGECKVLPVSLGSRDVDFAGYGVDVSLYEAGVLLQEASTSFDVVSDWRKAPRYGFLCDFYPGDRGDAADIETMRKYHINLVQFYDWMYRHDELVPPQSEFQDLMGRKLDFDVVKEKVELCHKHGMKALGYGAVYAACNEFYARHPDWALYNSCGEALDFIGVFKIMNISPDSPWHMHIIGQYRAAIREAGFDGIHMDTYGFPKTAISRLHGRDEVVRLDEHFPALINDARTELEQEKAEICLIFNNVGNWPVDTVAGAGQDAIYIEVWPPYERYWHIREIILRAKALGGGKPVILAAYMKPFIGADESSLPRAQFSTLLLTAAIAANGATHLLLGENNGILTQAYYVNYFRMDGRFSRVLRGYYDFIVRYSNILFRESLRDVSMTHVGGDNREYIFEGFPYSTYGEAGKVWVVVRECPDMKCISFINLCGNGDLWNEGKGEPAPQTDMKVRVLVDALPRAVYIASPDRNLCRPEPVKFSVENSDRGKYIVCGISELLIWSLLIIDM